MAGKALCCGILRPEMEVLAGEYDIRICFVDAALHVDPDKLARSVTEALKDLGSDDIPVILGTNCHPELEKMAAELGGRVIRAGNCIEAILGDKMAQLDSEARTFYLTGGWLENWRKIFIEGLGWDEIDARQNFGYYERILLLDTGVGSIDEEKVLEFYDYTCVPVEIIPVDLHHLKKLLEQMLNS